jgi:predicted oxidoreductase
MANHPTISIIMANRNGAKHIGHALNSVQAQSLQAIEILVVDDASTDTSPAMVEAMAAADPRIRLIRRRAAGGPAAARNTGLACAQGEWIAGVWAAGGCAAGLSGRGAEGYLPGNGLAQSFGLAWRMAQALGPAAP